jgi:hypothetical protein
MPNNAWNKSFHISIWGARATAICHWQMVDYWHKTKSHIWLFLDIPMVSLK